MCKSSDEKSKAATLNAFCNWSWGWGVPNYPPLDHGSVSNNMLTYRQTLAVVIKYSYFTQYLRVHCILKFLKSAAIIKYIRFAKTNKLKHINFMVDCK